ncbi:MAG: thiamine phosphate synthase [Tuberibacillus sp.]
MLKAKFDTDYSLYLVTNEYDEERHSIFFNQIQRALEGGVTVLQLRAKRLSTRRFYEVALKVKELARRFEVPFIVNDRLDIALAVSADGLHIGQDDIPASVARRWLGNDKILGVSAKNLDEARQALKDGADYLGVGSMFSTKTKDDAVSTSVEELKRIQMAVDLPIVAIGGINTQNARLMKDTGVQGIAVVSAVLEQADPADAAKKLKDIFI